MSGEAADIDQYAGYLYTFMQKYISLSPEDFNRFIPYLEVRRFNKKETILPQGQVEDYLNFVVKGLVRKYICIEKEQKTLQLATEGHIVQSERSFYNRLPSEMITEALEPSLLISMRYDNVQLCLDTIRGAEQLGRQLVTHIFIKKDARYFADMKNTTRQRFLQYVTDHPHMLHRVPQKILASYLNIKPETFSRMKRLLQIDN